MFQIHKTLALIAIIAVALSAGCTKRSETPGEHAPETLTASRGEHDGEGGEGEGEGEHAGEGRENREGGGEGEGEHEGEGREGREGEGEHAGEEGGHDEEGEESGTEYALDATYDEVRNGARLILAYDAETNTFTGTVENTTERTLARVRVEVHLSNGTELGPTTPADLEPGEKRDVTLTATEAPFDAWSAHPEVGGGS